MSMQRLRELRLYRKLEHDLNYRERINEKLREFSTSTTNNSINSSQISHNFHNNMNNNNNPHQYKLNNTKKYQIIQQKNAQIQRQNKILYNKIHNVHNNKSRINMINNLNNKSRINEQQYKIKKKFNNNNRTTRTEEYGDIERIHQDGNNNNRKKYNVSEQKQKQRNQNTMVIFQRNQQLMMKKNKNKVKTQGITNFVHSPIYHNNNNGNTPQSISRIKYRMFSQHSPPQHQPQQTILFQGQAQIDSIKFKTKILIRDSIYYLIGKNKHTQILLKMQLSEYKKFQKNVLKGNPGKIFQYLEINKGQIRFRTIEEDVEGEIRQMEEYEERKEEKGQKIKEKMHKNQKKLKKALMQRHNQDTQIVDVKEQMLRRIQHQKMKYYQQNSANNKKFRTIPDNYYANPTKFSSKIPISSSDNHIRSRKRQFSTILPISPHNSLQLNNRLRKQNNLNKSMKKKLYESPIYYHDNDNDEDGKYDRNYEDENSNMYEGRDGKHNNRLPYLG